MFITGGQPEGLRGIEYPPKVKRGAGINAKIYVEINELIGYFETEK